jgi:hypothetical protein
MSFSDGEFEGYAVPSFEAIDAALQDGWVVVDANVLLNLYPMRAPARELALKCFSALGDRLWVPHQVVREFWRNRPARLLELKKEANPVEALRTGVASLMNKLTPASRPGGDVRDLKESINAKLDELQQQIEAAVGEPLDWRKALANPADDPLVTSLQALLDKRVGDPPSDEGPMIEEGKKRFARKQPPGWIDGPKKADQLPEQGTGDYLLWEQTLSHLESVGISSPFVIVSNDEKEDWRLQYSGKDFLLGARPEMVVEARQRLGQPVYVISPSEFYDVMVRRISDADSSATASLIESATSSVDHEDAGWTRRSFELLLRRLRSEGYLVQEAAILAGAGSADGFVPRSAIYSLGSYEETRSLKRFSLPARRAMLALIEDGELAESATEPLVAVYDGPGRTVGYRVPLEFAGFVGDESKVDLMEHIASMLNVQMPDLGPGGTVPTSFLVDCATSMGLSEEAARSLGKQGIARWIVEAAGHRWTDSFQSIGGGITRLGLSAVRDAIKSAHPETGTSIDQSD